MIEIQEVLNKLQGVKKNGNGWQARCPAHDDHVASLSISEKEGKLLLHCFAGCSFRKIMDSLDFMTTSDISFGEDNTPTIVATYDYKDALTGEPYQVVRYKPKAFKQRRPDGKGGWLWNLRGITPNLFLRELLEIHIAKHKETPLFLVEGEKDVLSLMEVGQVATSISGGALAKWHPSLVPLFQGSRVVIIPDNDEPGRKYAHYVANLLYGWAEWIKIINLPTGKDVSDYLEVFLLNDLEDLVVETDQYIPTGAVTREEFNELRGLNIYLLRSLMQKKRKFNTYE